ncbi:unnamed protein product [Amoebophrya sp. A25]|nr:unnamed protein product [Amoebophrya sp. A25]|eukprot:GSA25T00019178001.1
MNPCWDEAWSSFIDLLPYIPRNSSAGLRVVSLATDSASTPAQHYLQHLVMKVLELREPKLTFPEPAEGEAEPDAAVEEEAENVPEISRRAFHDENNQSYAAVQTAAKEQDPNFERDSGFVILHSLCAEHPNAAGGKKGVEEFFRMTQTRQEDFLTAQRRVCYATNYQQLSMLLETGKKEFAKKIKRRFTIIDQRDFLDHVVAGLRPGARKEAVSNLFEGYWSEEGILYDDICRYVAEIYAGIGVPALTRWGTVGTAASESVPAFICGLLHIVGWHVGKNLFMRKKHIDPRVGWVSWILNVILQPSDRLTHSYQRDDTLLRRRALKKVRAEVLASFNTLCGHFRGVTRVFNTIIILEQGEQHKIGRDEEKSHFVAALWAVLVYAAAMELRLRIPDAQDDFFAEFEEKIRSVGARETLRWVQSEFVGKPAPVSSGKMNISGLATIHRLLRRRKLLAQLRILRKLSNMRRQTHKTTKRVESRHAIAQRCGRRMGLERIAARTNLSVISGAYRRCSVLRRKWLRARRIASQVDKTKQRNYRICDAMRNDKKTMVGGAGSLSHRERQKYERYAAVLTRERSEADKAKQEAAQATLDDEGEDAPFAELEESNRKRDFYEAVKERVMQQYCRPQEYHKAGRTLANELVDKTYLPVRQRCEELGTEGSQFPMYAPPPIPSSRAEIAIKKFVEERSALLKQVEQEQEERDAFEEENADAKDKEEEAKNKKAEKEQKQKSSSSSSTTKTRDKSEGKTTKDQPKAAQILEEMDKKLARKKKAARMVLVVELKKKGSDSYDFFVLPFLLAKVGMPMFSGFKLDEQKRLNFRKLEEASFVSPCSDVGPIEQLYDLDADHRFHFASVSVDHPMEHLKFALDHQWVNSGAAAVSGNSGGGNSSVARRPAGYGGAQEREVDEADGNEEVAVKKYQIWINTGARPDVNIADIQAQPARAQQPPEAAAAAGNTSSSSSSANVTTTNASSAANASSRPEMTVDERTQARNAVARHGLAEFRTRRSGLFRMPRMDHDRYVTRLNTSSHLADTFFAILEQDKGLEILETGKQAGMKQKAVKQCGLAPASALLSAWMHRTVFVVKYFTKTEQVFSSAEKQKIHSIFRAWMGDTVTVAERFINQKSTRNIRGQKTGLTQTEFKQCTTLNEAAISHLKRSVLTLEEAPAAKQEVLAGMGEDGTDSEGEAEDLDHLDHLQEEPDLQVFEEISENQLGRDNGVGLLAEDDDMDLMCDFDPAVEERIQQGIRNRAAFPNIPDSGQTSSQFQEVQDDLGEIFLVPRNVNNRDKKTTSTSAGSKCTQTGPAPAVSSSSQRNGGSADLGRDRKATQSASAGVPAAATSSSASGTTDGQSTTRAGKETKPKGKEKKKKVTFEDQEDDLLAD